ncbi:MAG TPA: S8 family peptidase [Spirochaetota bacterium]|nr:S8 family peptidase [Spirochaetota bacterium]
MFLRALVSVRVFTLVVMIAVSFSCGCGGDGGSGGGPSTYAIAPDPVHTGNDCGCGGKNEAGAGMTLNSAKKLFPSTRRASYVTGELIVKFREGTSPARAARIIGGKGAVGMKALYTRRAGYASTLKKITLSTSQSVEGAVKEFSRHPEVEYAEPNYIYRASMAPNDASYARQWAMKNTGQEVNGVTGDEGMDIGAEDAWETLTDCGDVIVAVLDTGINYNHRDLYTNMWGGGAMYPKHGCDFVDDDKDPMDLNGHGTHCAGIIGARGNDAKGLAGVCWSVRLMAVRVLDASGNGALSDVAQGIEFAIAQGAHIINASLGGPESKMLRDAVLDARDNGVIIVAAAGNEETDYYTNSYPAAYGTGPYNCDNVISVAAIDQEGKLASFSNYGAAWVDIAAPGVNILSTWPGQTVLTEESFTGWTMERGWGRGTYSDIIPGVPIIMLTNPPVFGDQYLYENNLDSTAYHPFDPGAYGADSAVVSFLSLIDVEENYDYLRFVVGPKRLRPTTLIDEFTGTTAFYLSYDITPLIGDIVNLGFQLKSDYSKNGRGAGIAWFDMARLYHNSAACMFSDGTSMAAPHVAGVAALCVQHYKNRKGSYTRGTDYSSIIQAVLDGAVDHPSLNGLVASRRMLSAPGALVEVTQH